MGKGVRGQGSGSGVGEGGQGQGLGRESRSTHLLLVCAEQFPVVSIFQFSGSLESGQRGVEDEQFTGTAGGLECVQTCLNDRTEYNLGLAGLRKHLRYLLQ